MWNVLSSVGSAAYSVAEYAGVVGSGDPPPYPCAYPFRPLQSPDDVTTIDALLAESWAAFNDLHDAKDWDLLEYIDPEAAEGGDLRLWSRPQIGTYHMVMATMSIKNADP